MKKQKSILKFWRDIETFNLPNLPDKLPSLKTNIPLPWDITKEPLKDAKRRHILYFGKQRKLHITSLIDDLTGQIQEKPDWIEKVSGDTCMAVLIVEENGLLGEDGGYLQASYIHGLKRLQAGQDLGKVTEDLEKSQLEFNERHGILSYSDDPDELSKTEPISWHELRKEINVLNELKINGLKCDDIIYYQTVIVSKKIKNTDTTFLNSFYLEDLNWLINSDKHWNKGLNSYLDLEAKVNKRIDVLENVDAFFETINPEKMPVGRWPSNPGYGAYTAQLAAMNTALFELNEGGIMGINGPPGTGKTTLLSDIVAEVIVRRAKRLADFNNTLLFMPAQRINRASDFLMHYPIKTAVFDDAGIVVASNNNAAVENISKELPQKTKIHVDFAHADYFSRHTKSLIEKESWGLLAVALGNSENRKLFKSSFWFNADSQESFSQYLGSIYNNKENLDQTPFYQEKFQGAKMKLTQLLQEFDAFRISASSFHSLLSIQLSDLKEKAKLEKNWNELKEGALKLSHDMSKLEEEHSQHRARLEEIKEVISLHNLDRPSLFFLQKLFNTNSFKQWKGPLQQHLVELNQYVINISESREGLQRLKAKLRDNESGQKSLQEALALIEKRLSNYLKQKEALHSRYGIAYSNLPDENLYKAFSDNKADFHKSNPWSSEKLNKLRSEIFLTSLKIHEYAVLSNAKQFRNNINILLEMLDGKATVSKEIATSVWKTLFFLVPVISTSLASVSRLFKNLEENSIGWLLLDEAGQAPIQSAVGIISRSKRSVIIGDPLQIEPVITTPPKLTEILNRPYNNEPTWFPGLSSVQQLADRATMKGTDMRQSEDITIWTGFPLRTHRRCADPMFSIANHIAYSDQMVKATMEDNVSLPIGPSAWFHVAGTTVENKHVIKEEIELLKAKIELLGDTENIFVISPFKTVAERCSMELSTIFPKVKCGTIHTFQGKEAKIVFLILGSDPKKEGARIWASAKPNMLNVALTRAKNHFYLIGNRTLWQSCNNFNYLSSILPSNEHD